MTGWTWKYTLQAVVGAFLLLSSGCIRGSEASCNSTTQYPQHGRCCEKCLPGHRAVAWCTLKSPTLCQPCPPNYYSSHYNNVHSCAQCRPCNKGYRQVETESCTPVKDTRCGCGNGTYESRFIKDGSMFWCCDHCPAGLELVTKCHFTNFTTECAPCLPGTFSDGSGSPCRNHTRCGVFESPSTSRTDAVCLHPPDNAAPWIFITMGVIAAIVLFLCLYHGVRLLCKRAFVNAPEI